MSHTKPTTSAASRGARTAQLAGTANTRGRTREVVLCVCGARTEVDRRAWKRYGMARCSGCGGSIDYRTLEVTGGK